MAGKLALALLAPALTGLLVLRACWPGHMPAKSSLALEVCLGAGWGLGLTSCGYFLWRLLIGSPGGDFIAAELAVLLGTGLLCVTLRRRSMECPPAGTLTLPRASGPLIPILGAAMGICTCSLLIIFVMFYLGSPHGEWDAWAIWNCQARFLFRAGPAHWPANFTALSHADYPLLLPATVARCWTYIGGETTLAPAIVSLLYSLIAIGTLVLALALLRSPGQGILAGLLLMGNRDWLKATSAQMADVPLSFFLLAAVVLFVIHDMSANDRGGLPALAGSMAGFGCWTKNEGLLLVLALCLARLAVALRGRRWREYGRETRTFLVGLIPTLLVLWVFKVRLAPANDILAGQGAQATLARLTDGGRYWQVASTFVLFAYMIGPGAPLLLAVYGLLLGRRPGGGKPGAFFPTLLLTVILAGYFFVYIITPRNVIEHMSNSLDRLLLQLWPLCLFAFFLFIATPREACRQRLLWRANPKKESENRQGVEM